MYAVLVLISSLSFHHSLVNTYHTELIKDFITYKQARQVVMFYCDEEFSTPAKDLMENGVYLQSFYTPTDVIEPLPSSMGSFLTNPVAIIADISCPAIEAYFKQNSGENTFNSSYTWLVVTRRKTTFDVATAFEIGCGLRVDSDVTWARNTKNDSSSFHFIDLYSTSYNICGPVQSHLWGGWESISGLYVVPGYNRITVRRNFNQIILRCLLDTSTTVMVEYQTSIDIDQLCDRHKNSGVPDHVKYHLSLVKFLQGLHNFSVHYTHSDGQLEESILNFDMVGTGVLQSLREDPLNIQIVHQSWSHDLAFIFRLTPEVNGLTSELSFSSPFTGRVWWAVLVVMVLVLGALQLTISCHSAVASTPSSKNHNHFLINMVGLIAQQGSVEASTRAPVRIVLYAILVMNFLLYNYYTASTVGELLSGDNQGPKSIEQLVECPLTVVFHNDTYHYDLMKELASLPSVLNLNHKQLPETLPDPMPFVPVYADVATAVRLLKRGGFAFHCEPTEAFREIAQQFDAVEVCELRTLQGLYSKLRLMSFVLPKGSMYAEQFKLTLTRANELGIIRRLLGMYRNEMPACQNGPLVQPVVMAGVATPFAILAAGIICSTMVLVAEKAIHYVKERHV